MGVCACVCQRECMRACVRTYASVCINVYVCEFEYMSVFVYEWVCVSIRYMCLSACVLW